MNIGATLAKARRDAGLTVAEVSERTRIRETIIRGIEQDDYSACGGDFYARGHLRSIARVVGADAAALVGEYDATVRAPEDITAAEALQPMLPIDSGGGRRRDEPRFGRWRDEPRGGRLPDEPIWRRRDEPGSGGRGPEEPRGPRRLNWTAVLGLALLAVVAFVGYQLTTGGSGQAPAAARVHGRQPAARPRPTVTRSATSSPTSSAPPVTNLTPVSAAAFGPSGTAQGDNPQSARLALAGDPATPWHTSWYATARFGNLRTGTGLLLDLGRPVTVTSARITLGSIPGADVELRAGNVATLAGLRTVAHATNAGSVLQLQPAGPVRGRYLLIWFTLLPPDGSGTYQADISGVSLRGEMWCAAA
jgi:transcriptional regulator with XRE-family HTH domain